MFTDFRVIYCITLGFTDLRRSIFYFWGLMILEFPNFPLSGLLILGFSRFMGLLTPNFQSVTRAMKTPAKMAARATHVTENFSAFATGSLGACAKIPKIRKAKTKPDQTLIMIQILDQTTDKIRPRVVQLKI